MSPAEFETLVAEAVDGLPERIRREFENLAFCVENKARRAKAREVGVRVGGALLGLYEGVPLLERGAGYGPFPPDKITIFQAPIEEEAGGNPARIRELVAEVVWHEVGHHLGFDDRELRRIEKKRAGRKARGR